MGNKVKIREEEVQYGDLFRAKGTFDRPIMFVAWHDRRRGGTEGSNWMGIHSTYGPMPSRRGFKDGYWERVDE